jgi:hypothetical protein
MDTKVLEDAIMERNEMDGARADRRVCWSTRVPMFLAAALFCLVTGLNLYRLMPARAPRNPWEASEVVEGWRSLHGLPVYELGPDGHATHLYGAWAPWVQGMIFRWVGPNNISGRLLTLASALATVTLIAASTRTKGSAWLVIVVWAALLGLNHRSGQYFSENRPDMPAMFLATAAVVLTGLGVERRHTSLVALGTACFIVGFFMKQVAIVFAVVPLVALILRGGRPTRSEVLMALAPSAAAVGLILSLKVGWPAVYYYSITMPGSYRIDWPRAANHVRVFLLESPLFVVLLGEWLLTDGGSMRKDRRMPWIVAVLVVGIPFCATALGRMGGTLNSLLPALLGMMAFCAVRLPIALAGLERRAATFRARVLLGTFAASLLFLTVFPRLLPTASRPPWDSAYDQAVAAVSEIPGTVVCPEDPTIPLYAKAHVGRGLFPEMDTNLENGVWIPSIPQNVVAEMRAADYIVDVQDYFHNFLDERVLRGMGFVPADRTLPDPSQYRLWRRDAAGPAANAARTAWNPAEDSSRRGAPDR